MKESACGHRGPENNWKERAGWENFLAAISALWGQDYTVPVFWQMVKSKLYQSSLWSPSWVLPQPVNFTEPLCASRTHKTGKTPRKNQHGCISCWENWEMKSHPQPWGAACPAQGGMAHDFGRLQLPGFFKTEKNSKTDQTTDSFCTWLEISLFSRAD